MASPGTGQEADPDSLRQGSADEVSRAGKGFVKASQVSV